MGHGFAATILRTNKVHKDFVFVVERICHCEKYGMCWSHEEYKDWSQLLSAAIDAMQEKAEARKYGHVFTLSEDNTTLIRAELGSLWSVIQTPRSGTCRTIFTSLSMDGEKLETHAIKMYWEPTK